MKKKAADAIQLLIVDDQQIIIEGLTALLKDVPEIDIAGGCNDPQEVLNVVVRLRPNVILMDLNMPGKDGIECLKELLEQFPDLRILMLTGYDDIALIREALKQGAGGYLLKNIGKEELIYAIKSVSAGKRFLDPRVQDKIIQSFTDGSVAEVTSQPAGGNPGLLSKREYEVLKLIAVGKKSSEIAETLFISPNTVDTHRKNILAKCDVKNTAELISFANKNGLL